MRKKEEGATTPPLSANSAPFFIFLTILLSFFLFFLTPAEFLSVRRKGKELREEESAINSDKENFFACFSCAPSMRLAGFFEGKT